MRLLYLAGWGYVAIAGALVWRARLPEPYPATIEVLGTTVGSSAAQWFANARPHCNPVEVQLSMAQSAPPQGWEGQGYGAACYALAGKIKAAEQLIDALPESERVQASGIVFEVVHPVADAGDDESAGPMMELVLRYWPNHYMALYHAGSAQFRVGQYELAKKNLAEFLVHYKQDDGWVGSARGMLQSIAEGKGK